VRRRGWIAVAALVSCLPTASPSARAAPDAKALRSRDVKVRLAAVESLRKDTDPQVEALLLSALEDEDGEVVESALAALGERGGAASVAPLVDLALGARIRRIRLAAVSTLARVDRAAAVRGLAKKASGPAGLAAIEGLSRLAAGLDDDGAAKALEKALRSKEPETREAAARGVLALPAATRLERVRQLLGDEDVVVVCATIDALGQSPSVEWIPLLLDRLDAEAVPDVVERRLLSAVRAAVATKAPGPESRAAAAPALGRAETTASPAVLARYARLVGLLGEAPVPTPPPAAPAAPPADAGAPPAVPPAGAPAAAPTPLVSSDDARGALTAALRSRDEGTRAAGVSALGRLRSEKADEDAASVLQSDASPRVRLAALRAIVDGRGIAASGNAERVVHALASDADPGLKEAAATALGVEGLSPAVPALVAALRDASWGVACCAAVSLGKTRDAQGVEPLSRLLGKDVKDWRIRGAAVAGLGHARQKKAVPFLIAALTEKEPAVARTAYEFLRRLTPKEFPPDPVPWEAWWEFVAPKYEFTDPAKAAREAQKGGYAPTLVGVYEKLDVVVLQSRGDHIETMLEQLGIEHRITRAASVDKAALHPFCLFVSNCTGEVTVPDVERLQWFVRVGGYLFGSCWALHHTVEPVWPGLVRKLPVKAEVLDNVLAERCPGSSPFLEGVFPAHSRPIYVLYGSHLVEVLRPEAVEVLTDSPQCAAHWGGGNLCCWFPAGHGVILDSANHFNLQGLERVTGLKTAQDRVAYSVDHKGVDWEEVRTLAAEKVWESQARAVERVRDYSAFRLLTNFVRNKRKADL
jgi:HEAT repeat protein